LIEEITKQTGVNASKASHMLSQVYDSYKNVPHLTRDQWHQAISQVANQNGVNASQAAQILSGLYLGERGHPSQFNISNASVGVAPFGTGFTEMRGSSEGTTPSSGLETGLGQYEGLNGGKSFRAGTPAESGDTVVDINDATTIAAVQASQSPGRVTNRSSPENRQYLVSADLQKIAQALGVPAQGGNELLVQNIRQRLTQMSAQQQQQFAGGLSPRSQTTFNKSFPGNMYR
jgi:hypothetical protein